MIGDILSYLPVVLIFASAVALLVFHRWRINIITLAILYLGIFWLVSSVWPLGLSAVKLVIGWMSAALLGMSLTAQTEEEVENKGWSWRAFRLVAAVFITIVVVSVSPQLQNLFPASNTLLLGAGLLIGLGLLQLGVTQHPLRVIFGLLTLLAGFETLYASVEDSVLVAGLLAAVNLGLALIGVYWLSQSEEEKA